MMYFSQILVTVNLHQRAVPDDYAYATVSVSSCIQQLVAIATGTATLLMPLITAAVALGR